MADNVETAESTVDSEMTTQGNVIIQKNPEDDPSRITYVVAYTASTAEGRSGTGSITISRSKPVSRAQDVEAIQKYIVNESKGAYTYAAILNIVRLPV